MITDVILDKLPEGRYKDYFEAHKEEYIDWDYDHEDYPFWMFFPAELNDIDDEQSRIVKEL